MNITVDIGQLLIGLGMLLNIFMSWHNTRVINKVQNNTNSMKDELVALTDKESFARGVKQEKDATLARDIEQQKDPK
jgi:hypothetical protein